MLTNFLSYRKARLLVLMFTLLLIFVYSVALPYYVRHMDALLNHAINKRAYEISDTAKTLHRDLMIADLHGDFLLWDRDFLKRHDRGMIDLPRLQQGNLSLQAFTIVSKIPKDINIHQNDDSTDQINLLVIAQHWPLKTLFSLKQRALYQAEKLHGYAQRSQGQFITLKNKADLRKFFARKKSGENTARVLLASFQD